MPVQADQARLAASVGKLDGAGRTVTKAAPAALPWVVTGVSMLLDFADGMSLGGSGNSGSSGDSGDATGDGTSGGSSGKGKGGMKGLVGEVLSTLKDYVVGISGGMLANKLGTGGSDHESHEDSVEQADDAVLTCDRVLEAIQSLCADEVEACVDGAVDVAMGLYAAAKALQPTDPVAAQAMLESAAQLLCSALDGVGALVEGRNTQMGECMDLTIAECLPAAEEGRCRVPLATDPAPEVDVPDCDVAPVPAEVATVGASAAPVPAAASAGSVSAATSVASVASAASVGVVPQAPCPPSLSVPGLAGEISGWVEGAVKGAVEGAVAVAVENAGSLIDIDLNLCPPDSPDGGDDACSEPEPTPEPCDPEPEPEPCEPEPEPCEPESEPEPEPEPESPAPPTVDPEKGFDKSTYLQGAEEPGADVPSPAPGDGDTRAASPAPVDPAAADGPSGATPDPAGATVPDELPESPANHDGWTPDVWTTGEKSGDAPSVARSGQW
ncbi:hypothetical protein AALF15_05785 [Corynebacteriaceae bacterium 7-707]